MDCRWSRSGCDCRYSKKKSRTTRAKILGGRETRADRAVASFRRRARAGLARVPRKGSFRRPLVTALHLDASEEVIRSGSNSQTDSEQNENVARSSPRSATSEIERRLHQSRSIDLQRRRLVS